MYNSNPYSGERPGRPRRLIKEMPYHERPLNRLAQAGQSSLSSTELLALILGTPDALELAEDVMAYVNGLANITRYGRHELQQIDGVGEALAARILAATEFGRRLMSAMQTREERPKVTSPADAANLVMAEMIDLPQEEFRVILLDTRNHVIDISTIYRGSLNTSVIRLGEVLRTVIVADAAAFIAVHNHPTGDPSASPEDCRVTRQLREAADLIDVSLLDHVIVGHGRFVSLKERGLGGFDTITL